MAVTIITMATARTVKGVIAAVFNAKQNNISKKERVAFVAVGEENRICVGPGRAQFPSVPLQIFDARNPGECSGHYLRINWARCRCIKLMCIVCSFYSL